MWQSWLQPREGYGCSGSCLKPPKSHSLSPTAVVFACMSECVHGNEPRSPSDKPHLLHPGSLPALGMRWPLLGAESGAFKSPIVSSCCGQALGIQQATPCLVHHHGPFGTWEFIIPLFSYSEKPALLRKELLSTLLPSLPESSFSRENLDQKPNNFLWSHVVPV